MFSEQNRHIRNVLAAVYDGQAHCGAQILSSWQRSVFQYGLNPERPQPALIVPHHHLLQHQQALDSFLDTARFGLRQLWQQIHNMGYVVLLADSEGIVVEALSQEKQIPLMKQAGLHLGALWQEKSNGTSAVGMVAATQQATVVHKQDHFEATHIGLTCTAAPIFDSRNRLRAILDVSAPKAIGERSSQQWVLPVVKQFAALIEHAQLMREHQQDWLVRLGVAAEFLDVAPEYLLAIDDSGMISGANHAFFEWAEQHLACSSEQLIGHAFDTLFGQSLITLYSAKQAAYLQHGEAKLYAKATPPMNRVQHADLQLPSALAQLYGANSRYRTSLQRIATLADTHVPILLYGETGSGKEFLARAIHLSSRRAKGPFVAVNCAAIPENLIESELYGYVPNSFTGADRKGKVGLIEAADGGTLFLDEIGDMPLILQSRLLRVLSEREVLPIGATRARKVDIRVVSATHCDLQAQITQGKFREDLYYRLNGCHIELPALRQRDDFDYITRIILQRAAEKCRCPLKALSAQALAILRAYQWPGNLRQLAAVLEVALMTSQHERIEAHDLPDYIQSGAHAFFSEKDVVVHEQHRQAFESRENLQAALVAQQGNVSALARQLNVSRMTVYRYLKKYGLNQ